MKETKQSRGGKKMKLVKQNAGFSLVELMVVIAIIATLATIAIPKYNVFIAKSRTAEAQSNLAGLYSFNKNYFTEFNGYTSSLLQMGFKAEGKLRYVMGFTAAACPNSYAQSGGTQACATPDTFTLCGAAVAGANASACQIIDGVNGAATAADIGGVAGIATPAAPWNTFVAGASAAITSVGPDQWSMNQDKILIHTADGTGG